MDNALIRTVSYAIRYVLDGATYQAESAPSTGRNCQYGSPVIWLYGNAQPEMDKIMSQLATVQLNARCLDYLIKDNWVVSAENAIAYLLYRRRKQSFTMGLDCIQDIRLNDEVNKLERKYTDEDPLVVSIEGLPDVLSANPLAARDLLELPKLVQRRYGNTLCIILSSSMSPADFSHSIGIAEENTEVFTSFPVKIDSVELARREERASCASFFVQLMRQSGACTMFGSQLALE